MGKALDQLTRTSAGPISRGVTAPKVTHRPQAPGSGLLYTHHTLNKGGRLLSCPADPTG